MTYSHNPDAIADLNQFTLRRLARTLVASQNQFAWLWLQCNSISLREQIIQELKVLCPLKWRELNLDANVTNLYQTVIHSLGHNNPSVLMITGLENLREPDDFFYNLHLTQAEFAKNFRFPLLIWLDDQDNQKLKHYAPELRQKTVEPFRFEDSPSPSPVNPSPSNSSVNSQGKIKLPQAHFEEKMQQLSQRKPKPETFSQTRIKSPQTSTPTPPPPQRPRNYHSSIPEVKTIQGPTLPRVMNRANQNNSATFSNFATSSPRTNFNSSSLGRRQINSNSQILIIEPDRDTEITQLMDALRADISVLINFSQMSAQEAQRCLDFLSGGTFAIDGDQTRIGEKIFLFTPNCIKLSREL